MKNTLENILNSVKEIRKNIKKHWKETLTAIVLPFIFTVSIDADRLKVYNRSNEVSGTPVNIKHVDGAEEGHDINDSIYINSPSPLQIYSNNPNHNPNELSTDARGPDSTTTFNLELYNNGFPGFADNYIRFSWYYEEGNDEWKNMFFGDTDDSNNVVCDVKYVIVNGSTYPSGTPYGDIDLPDVKGSKEGVYDKRKIFLFNHADFNRDKKVNGLDYAIFANNFGRNDPNLGSNVGADPSNLDDYSDINRDGVIDMIDLDDFTYEWLWDANDPNTW